MSNNLITWQEANKILQAGYPSEDDLKRFPFAKYLQKLWNTDVGYKDHGPCVLIAMNALLAGDLGKVLTGGATKEESGRLNGAVTDIRHIVGWDDKMEAMFRIVALYHDIGKYIIKERHPIIGWHIVQYIDLEERERLRKLLDDEENFRLLMIILRDHDQFGVLSTGEASYPILLRAANSGDSLESQKRIISALALCNLADMVGTFKVTGETSDRLVHDRQWFLEQLEYCWKTRGHLDEHVIHEAAGIRHVLERIRRLLMESSRNWPNRRDEVRKMQLLSDQFDTVFGSENAKREFALQFTHICKLDYGKRFLEALMEYCEGPSQGRRTKAVPRSNKRMSSERVVYAVFAILKRIATTYAPMMQLDGGSGNLVGVELKDLTPAKAPEKTAQIIELIFTGHYPGLTWMMSDVPAWYF